MATSHSCSGIDLSDYALEAIGDDGAFVLCRGYRTVTSRHPASILVVMPAAEHPRLESLQMLEHEFALRFDLDTTWAVRPLALVHQQGRTCLVLDDPGGELLARRLGAQPMELGLFLRLGVGLAAALGALHRRSFMHKDLTPDHVMIDEATGRVWLTGFRIASRVRRQRQTPEPPEVIAGTLPYMAPEQTGRMNRSIDSRSDLYALGVTLYEMLTGTLPFTASDPMGWVHCHIARQPIPPAERLEDLPPPVSAIIVRLLAKTAEERYQTAAGVERDLRRCLTQWEAGHHDDFPLGEQDTPDRLLIPERLYGREREIETLLAAFDRVVTTGTPELVLVSGYSGIGKTSVVNELHKALVPPRALFASGKFDQNRRGIPYATLAQAFQSLVRGLLVKSDAEMAVWRAAFGEALDPNGGLLVDLVPELKLIIGEQPPLPDLPPAEAQRRFQAVCERFIRVFARPEHPLALFVDDLQWLDSATLDLLEELLTQGAVQNLLVIGAYRDNEVGSAHPLMRKVHAIREAGAAVHEIALAPLAQEDLTQLVADALHAEPQRVATLARLVGDKTAGNPFFTIQFLTALDDEGLLTFDHAHARWSWDLGGIRARRYTDNVADLMFGKLARLPAVTQQALQSLACLGSSAEVTTLALVLGTAAEQVHADLWEAVRLGLVELVGGSYRFLHDRVQEAAYGLVPEGQRAHEHLRIGRLLAAHTRAEKREEVIFEIVNQLNRGAPLMASQDEREQLSQLNLVAGQRAKASAAYAVALKYFVSGAALLPENAWESCSELAFALELHGAECEFLCGDLVSAEERLSILAAHATRLADEASVACLRITLYTVLRRPERAVEIGLSYLTKSGIAWSPHPTDQEVVQEHERLWRELDSRAIESLLDLPVMSEPRIQSMLEVLSELLGPTYFTDLNLEHLVLLRMAILSIQHGNTHASAVAYAYLNAVVGARFGRYAEGYRFGVLGMDLVDKKGLDRAKPRVYRNMAAWVVPWVRPLREARALLLRALEEVENWRPLPYYITWVYTALLTHRLASGDPLLEADREAEEGRRRLAQRARAGVPLDFMTGQLGLIRTLRGLTPVFGSFGSEELDEHDLEQHLQDDPGLAHAACWYWIRKLQAYVYSAERDRAAAMAAKAERFLWTASADFLEAEYHFHGGLARAAAAGSAVPDQRRELLADVAAHHRRLLEWAANCPENFESRAALVGAEIARLDGREWDAERLYEEAIRSARVNGFLCIEALANEMAGRFYGARGFETSASAHLREARYSYLRWGAEGKVRQLDEIYPHLGQEERLPDARATISEHVAQLDLATVLKALQAVSGEIVLERLLDRLMRMVIEHAGAERGVLLLTGRGGLLMQAEATISAGAIGVRVCEIPVSADDLAETVVRYVARTQETVILDDASASNPFSSDTYIHRTRARSILCLPLVKQGRLIALLYLENHLAPGVFTPARVAVLQVLAPQAAMSLENSRLYRELERRESKIRRLVDTNIVGVAMTRVDGAIIDANDAALEIVGYTREDARSGRVGWRELTPPDWQEASDRAVAQLQATGSFDLFEKELLRRDGTRVPVLLAGAAVDDTRQESVVFVIDLTERKRAEAELRRARTALARQQRASMLGEMAAAIAHEIRQPIAAAMIDATACLRALADNRVDLQQARGAASRMVKEATWADEIIHRTTALYKQETTRRERVDVNAVIREMTLLLQQEAGAPSISVRTELAESIPDVRADRVQLQQVFMNLMLNAIEAMKDKGGELTIRSQVNQEGGLLISVSDTGVGLPTENADEIFNAFVTSKPQGAGMGLAITRSIVESHGGRLWATANAGPGATLLFTLPREMDGDPAQ